MNYYEHHIGDYLKDTAHLSMIEDAAYRRLIDVYYTRETPLPTDRKAVQKLARAQSKEERAAVDYVLDEFFELREDGWHQSRCDEEIEKYREKAPRAQEKRDNAKARQDKARARRRGMFDELAGHGVTPPWDTTTAELETLLSRYQTQARHTPVTRDSTATQAPDTSHQTPEVNQAAATTEPPVARDAPSAAATPLDPIHVRACELTALVRSRGTRLNAMSPDVRSWAEQGVTDAQLLTAFDVAEERRAAKGDPTPVNAGLLTAILRDVIATPQKARASPSPQRNKQTELEARNRAAVEQFLAGGETHAGA